MIAALSRFIARLRAVFTKRALDEDLNEELAHHLELLTRDNLKAGMAPEEARRQACIAMGGLEQAREQHREARGFVWLEQIGKDIAFATRSLCRARGFTLTVLTMLVMGIGISTFVFNLTAWILIFDQPYPHPDQLWLVGFKDKRSPSNLFRSTMQFNAYREQTTVFSEYAAVTRDVANVVIDGEPLVVNLLGASIDCFHTLGIKPPLGRGFLPEEYRPGAGNVVVISDLFWRKHFHAVPDVLGRQVIVDQQPCTVIGVLAAGQPFPPAFDGDIYRPFIPVVDAVNPLTPVVYVIGRLAPAVSREQAGAALASVKLPTLPPWATAYLAEQEPILIRPTEIARPETFWVMAIAGILLYSIACLNAMNLMLVRLLGRRQELSIRLALGGTRWQIARLLTIESLELALVASVVVIAAVHWLFPPLFALISGSEAEKYASALNAPTLRCIAVLTLVASIAVVLVPVWRLMDREINAGLKDGGSAASEGRGVVRLRTALVIFQAALAVVLLAGTGLMVRSFERLHRSNLGFDPAGKVKVTISFPRGYDLAPEARLQLFERLQQRLATIPGVRAVSFGQDTLLEGAFTGAAQLLMADGTYQSVAGNFVTADYWKTAGLTLKKGQWFSSKRGEYGVVINETFAKARFGDEDPIGKSFKLLVSGDFPQPVVGVVGDVKESVRSSPGMRMYTAEWVYPLNISTLLLRLDHDPGKEFAGLIRHSIYVLDPKLIVSQVATINEIVGNGMWAERYAFRILKVLTIVAFALAVAGLFAVIVHTVESRMKEFGVRLALGAQPANLHRLVMKRGLATAACGVAVGVAGALGLTRFMQSLLFETTPYDPLVYGAVAIILLAAAAAACWLPARRAARVDITRLLRAE
jgi:putative ABC transport system permease protein